MTPARYEELLLGCENEKLHLSGQIQPFGAIIRVDRESMLITHASANIEDFVGVSCEMLLAKNISVLDWGIEEKLKRLPNRFGASSIYLSCVQLADGLGDIFLHSDHFGILIEIENSTNIPDAIDVDSVHLELLNAPSSQAELACHNKTLLDAIREIIGFDRVMIYHFLDDWSGEVLAESAKDALGSYLGLRFPASDIPAIARNLYLLNPSRFISDTNSSNVNIFSSNLSVDNYELDLTYSDLRSVSPVHLQYLSNMSIRASFSIPIRVSGSLWGLVACHSLTPKFVPLKQRNDCTALVQNYSTSMAAYKSSKSLQLQSEIDIKINNLSKNIADIKIFAADLRLNSDILMEMLSSYGMAALSGENVFTTGLAPNIEKMRLIDNTLEDMGIDPLYFTDCVTNLFVDNEQFEKSFSGMLVLTIKSKSGLRTRVYWFRPEEPKEIAWAGNPDKPADEDKDALALSPRRSFEKWTEIKHGYSRVWSHEDKTVALRLTVLFERWFA